jgi:hypothetical protein
MPLTRHVHSLLLKRIKLVMINLVMHYFKDNTCIYLYTRPCLLSTSCSQLYKHLNFQVVRDIVYFKDNIYLYTRPCLLSTSCSQLYKHLNFQDVRDIVHRIHLQTRST